jgi:hypothetical protein
MLLLVMQIKTWTSNIDYYQIFEHGEDLTINYHFKI